MNLYDLVYLIKNMWSDIKQKWILPKINREKYLKYFIIWFIIYGLLLSFFPGDQTIFFSYIIYVSLILRRLNDIGMNRWYSLLLIVPVINIWLFFYLFFKRGSDIPEKLYIKLNSESYKNFIDDIHLGDRVNFWGSPKNKNEIRVYLNNTIGGDGLLSVFKNKSIYDLLIEKKIDKKTKLISHILEKNKETLLVSIRTEEN